MHLLEDQQPEALLQQSEHLLRKNPLRSEEIAREICLLPNLEVGLLLRAKLIRSRAMIFLGNYEQGEPIAREALELSRLIGARREEGNSQNNIGVFRFIQRDFDSAISHYAAAELIFQELQSNEGLMRVHLNVGNVHYRKGDFVAALNEYEFVLEYAERENDLELQAKILTNMGGLYRFVLDDDETSAGILTRAVKIYEQLEDKIGMLKGYTNLADHFVKIADYDQAEELYNKAIFLLEETQSKETNINVYFGVLTVAIARKDRTKVYEILEDFEQQVIPKSEIEKAISIFMRCDIHIFEGEFRQAYDLLVPALPIIDKISDYNYRSTCYRMMVTCCRELQLFEEGMRAQDVIAELYQSESIRLSDQRLQYARVKSEVEAAKAQAEINRLKSIDLEKMVSQLEELHTENADYLAFMVHELKSPLHSIRSFSQLLMNEPLVTAPERNEFYSNIYTLSTRMLDLINRELERANGNNHVITEVNARPVIAYVISNMQYRAKEKSITLIGSVENDILPVFIDERSLVSIAENLLSNAIKFSEQGTTVKVEVRSLPKENPTRLLFSVEDQGPGLSSADMERIFMPFGKLSARPTLGEDSTGIGLHYVKKLVDKAQGTIWCESKTGQGAKFFVELPLASNRNRVATTQAGTTAA